MWWTVLEQLATLAFALLQHAHATGLHGAFKTQLIVLDAATGTAVATLDGPQITL